MDNITNVDLTQSLSEDVARRFGVQLRLSALGTAPGYVVLNLIRVEPAERGEGRAESAMRELCEAADKHGWTLATSPVSDFGASKARLKRFYTRHGFKSNTPRRDFSVMESMIRPPRREVESENEK